MSTEQRRRWQHLTQLLDRLERSGVRSLSVPELKELCRLYRQVTIDLSRARTDGDDPDLVRYLNTLAARAHGQVYRTRPVNLRPLVAFLIWGFPRLVRRQALPILIATAIFLVSTLASCLAVVRQPELAYSLFDEQMVEYENVRLEKQAGEYKGNFTFDIRESPFVAVFLIANNVRAAALAFGLGALCCLPGILLLVYNGRMLGTLSGLMLNHGYFADFYSLMLCHGVLELTAFCISGGAGLTVGWAVIAPGRHSRRAALRQKAGEAFGLLAGSVILLVFAGLIESFVTPQFTSPVRWTVAVASALGLVIYFGWFGRERETQAPVTEGRGRRSPGND